MTDTNLTSHALLGDSPVLEAGRPDLLHFASTAKVLAGAAVETQNPLTIGIFGEWGTGKTSLMRLIQDEVKKNEEAVAVWFNAWQFEKEEHLIVPLVATINKELMKKRTKAARSISNALRSIAYGFSVKGKIGIPLVSEAEVNLSGKDMIERYQELSKDSILSRSLYFDAFERLEKCAKEGDAPRIVVFVDDLDRCFPDKAVELIEHIKLVLNQRGFAFVLGVNEDIIQAVVKMKFENDYRIDPAYAENYLDKIVQVKVPVPQRKPADMSEYIGALLDEGKVFSAELKPDLVPLIAEACRRNPRSIVRLLNRIMVNYWVGQLEKKSFDPLALLIHIATDENRYSAFREALDVSIMLEGESVSNTIGCYLSDRLGVFSGNAANLIPSLREPKPRSRGDVLDKVIEILSNNRYLCNLLRSEIGRQWLRDEDGLRHRVGEASESTMGERKTKGESEAPIPSEIEDPISELLKNMVKIPAGEFMMGSEEYDSEKPVHRVALEAFEISAMPVTQAQYEAVMKVNPSYFKGPNNPVENVSWEDATKFCEKLSSREGQKITLPSEAQWEYACRAGSTTRYCFGDSDDRLDEYAWYEGNSGGKTHTVGGKKPNAWGLYDMHGNVWEWCQDTWHDSYTEAPSDGSAWESGENRARVIRGGNWNYYSRYCRSSIRYNDVDPGSAGSGIGFRVARTP